MIRTYVTDDNGLRWYFTGQRIKCENDDTGREGGYHCDSFQKGIWQLAAYGYIENPCQAKVGRGNLDLRRARGQKPLKRKASKTHAYHHRRK